MPTSVTSIARMPAGKERDAAIQAVVDVGTAVTQEVLNTCDLDEDDRMLVGDWKGHIEFLWRQFSMAAYERADRAQMRLFAIKFAAMGTRLAMRCDRPTLRERAPRESTGLDSEL